jgi:branched-chain amino acid transport system ATP-binding protein
MTASELHPADGVVLEGRDISLAFGGVSALDSVSFDLRANELLAIIGPNGAGKTSLFNCLSGVYRPQVGSLRYLEHDLLSLPPHRIAALGIARMFQNVALFENLTMVENISSGRHHLGTTGVLRDMFRTPKTRREETEHRRAVEEIIDFLEIESYRMLPVGMLPLGIQKRVELGRALAMKPSLLLLDEPVAGMNREETEDMARFILDIREERNIPMILVEHDMGLVMDLADRVLVLNFGQPIAFGTPEEIRDDPAVIQAYLGAESA